MKDKNLNFEAERYGLRYRLVNESDAEFIVKLRNDPKLSQYIHSSCNDVESQIEWIRKYKVREEIGIEYYFIFYKNGERVGLYRIYNIHDNIFTSGSWLFKVDVAFECSVLAAIIGHEIAFDTLNLDYEDAFDGVHIDNKKVRKFNKMLGYKELRHFQDEKGEYIALSLTKDDFHKQRKIILNLLGY